MDEKTIEEIIDLHNRDISVLFNELIMSNIHLDVQLKLRTHKQRELTYEDIKPHLEKGIAISQLINQRHLIEREDYFLTSANVFCGSIKNENYELADRMFKDLSYFKHNFLADSELRKVKIDYEILSQGLYEGDLARRR
jgi:hypothetical protein